MEEDVKIKKASEAFAEGFSALCREHKKQIVAVPVWVARDDGTFSLQVQLQVRDMPPA
jgi:hypothetical protein